MWSAYRSESSADTRYRNRSYGPPRPTEHDPPCRIRHRRPCHTSRPPNTLESQWVSPEHRHPTYVARQCSNWSGIKTGAPCTGPHLQETLRSAIQIRHARNARQASTQATRTSRRRGGRDHICGAVYSLIEENYVLQEGQRAAVEEDRADFALSPDPRYVTVRPASWPSPFLLRLKRVYHFSMRLFRDEICPVRSNGA